MNAPASPPGAVGAGDPRDAALPALSAGRKALYSLGDVTVNLSLSALALIYASYFLTQVAGLRPALAGLVPLVGRTVDAFVDPLMGRLSDHTRWRMGRRRPWFLIGAIPYGLFFALLWSEPPFDSQGARFAWYAGIYTLQAVAMTILSVPYYAIIPEMATSYDARTSLNTWRTVGSLVGTFLAVSMRPVANAFGGGSQGFAIAGTIFGIGMALPWLVVFRATFERPSYQQREAHLSLWEGLRAVLRHANFVRLTAVYIMGRIAMDLAGTLIILYVSFWLGRSEDFEPVMFLFLSSVVCALPFWLWVARGREKTQVFILGSLWWMASSTLLVFVQPDWDRRWMFVLVPLVGFGYAVVDLMPWSMVGEVIDEDDLANGERREGLYNGFFTFIRKLGGALGVALVLGVLDVAGYVEGARQSESARQAIRLLTAFAPMVFLGIGVWLALGYPLTRAEHQRIQRALDARAAAARAGPG